MSDLKASVHELYVRWTDVEEPYMIENIVFSEVVKNMGNSPDNGVVDHVGEVFGHPNLYVIDGAMIPKPTVHNPSHTIAALAERSAALIN